MWTVAKQHLQFLRFASMPFPGTGLHCIIKYHAQRTGFLPQKRRKGKCILLLVFLCDGLTTVVAAESESKEKDGQGDGRYLFLYSEGLFYTTTRVGNVFSCNKKEY